VPATVLAAKDWLNILADPELSWWHPFVTPKFAVQDTLYIANPLCHILAPHASQKVTIQLVSLYCRCLLEDHPHLILK
jgi:hypothetical protein